MDSWRRTGGEVPAFGFELLDGGNWQSRDPLDGKFTLLNVYRGKWCHQCKRHLTELDALVPELAARGVTVNSVSPG